MDPDRTPQVLPGAAAKTARSETSPGERARLESQRLETVGRLAGGVAHDFNNMLTAVIGYVDLASANLPRGTEEQEFLAQALGAAERATVLSRRLLAFARRQPAAPSPQNLGVLLTGMAPLLEAVMPGSSGLAVTADADPPWVVADACEVEHTIVSLALRARDAMPEGGELTLSTVRVDGADGGPASAGIEAVIGGGRVAAGTGAGRGAPVRVLWPISEAPPA